MSIDIYQNEINDGIAELVKTQASIAYCSPANLHRGSWVAPAMTLRCKENVLDKVVAENKGQVDLYYLESVLVSTGWNKNDDVFLSEETWAARNTPEDKQFNFMHDENDIIGHITGSYVLTKDGKAIADNEQRPEEFDIITQAVLYNSWTGEENKERMQKIIAEIEDGKWFVSMECLFAGFDYALLDKNGSAKVLARDEQSSFLTKHLRAYGGTGEYEGYQLGRALKNISFSGKGLVSKPANSRSIILNKKTSASISFLHDDSKILIGDFKMPDTTLLEKQLADLQSQLSEAKAENQAIKAQIEEAKDKEFASQIQSYKTTAEESKATIDQLNELIKSTQARVAELEDALAQSNEQLAQAKMHMDEMKKKEKMQKRMATLLDVGFDEEEASQTLASFDSLDDEAFDTIAMMMKKKAAKYMDGKKEQAAMDEEMMKKKKKMETEASEESEINQEAFEAVQTSEASLVQSDNYDPVEATRASVAEWLSNHVLSNNKK